MQHYFDALDRLKSGKPKIVPKSASITNDSVSLEAGFKKGSIKKSRPQFQELIEAIRNASTVQRRSPETLLIEQLDKAKKTAKEYQKLYEDALSREVSLVRELFDLKIKIAKLTGENVIPLLRDNIYKKK